MEKLQSLKKLLTLALICCIVVAINSASAQSQEFLPLEFNYNSSSVAVNKIAFTVDLGDALYDPSTGVQVNETGSWLLDSDQYTTEVEVLNHLGNVVKITFTLDDTSKVGSGKVAESMIGVIVVWDDNSKRAENPATIINTEVSTVAPEVSIFPNPASHSVSWKGNFAEGTVVQVIMPNGQTQILDWEAGTSLDVRSWARGFYMLRFINADLAVTQKLVLR